MKHKQRWAGAICCFVLFIVVCLFLATHMKGAFRAAGHPEIGLLFFILPGAVASFFSQRREVLKPLFGAMLAAPCSMLIMRLFFSPTRSFWQELAWLLSAVFWCALVHDLKRDLYLIEREYRVGSDMFVNTCAATVSVSRTLVRSRLSNAASRPWLASGTR